jgi:D-alanine transaminase
MPELMFIDGVFMDPAQGKVSAEDRGFNFGDGVYEVVRVYGGQPFTMREHLERFEHSAAGIELKLPRSIDGFSALIHELIDRSQLREAVVYMQVTRGAAPRNHLFAENLPPTLMAFIRESTPHPTAWRTQGASAIPELDVRWDLCNFKTISLLPNILAKNRARRAGAVEALFHERDGTVTEGSSSNAYAVRGGEIWTAPLGPKILPGITRGVILELARDLGIRVHETSLKIDEFAAADEIIMSATNLEILPVVRLGDKVIGRGAPGPMYHRVFDAYRERIRQDCHLEALVPISVG